jgi:alpha-beta hydrolase superfamily lysophospholipase
VPLGFLTAYQNIDKSIQDSIAARCMNAAAVWITGHSLGAVLATYCASRLRAFAPIKGCTFASPRAGCSNFVRGFNAEVVNWVRVVNDSDIVPGFPTDPPFRHAGVELRVHGGSRLFDIEYNHSLDRYIAGLQRLAPRVQNNSYV